MLKIFTVARVGRLTKKWHFDLSVQADPHYILGVEKEAPFQEIKVAFYKLANEFHPDKNDTKQAQHKFVIIKQAFESIKMEKGLMKPQHLYASDDRESMRANPQKYSMDQEEAMRNFRDYTVYSEKTAQNQEFMRFNSSFRTISDINQIKIKVEEGEMPDPVERFGLDKFKGRISSYSETGNKYLFVILTGMTIFTIISNELFNEREIQAKEGALKKMTQIQKRKTIEADLVENRRADARSIESQPEIRELKNRQILEDIKSGSGMRLMRDKVVDPSQVDRV